MRRGLFITFEGIEGVGKSTQVRLAADYLTGLGHTVLVTREPGGTALAERIRDLVLAPGHEPIPPHAELCLMFAARGVHTENLIRPALERGEVVLCDRYTDATYAYQGGGRGVPTTDIAALERVACRGLVPDLTLWFDAPVAIALERVRQRGGTADRFEREATAFFTRARDAYEQRALAEPGRFRRIDATGDLAAVTQQSLAVLIAEGLA